MALSNRDRIGQMFEVLAPALDQFLDSTIGPQIASDKTWVDVYAAVLRTDHGVESSDPSVQLKFVSENFPGRFKRGWTPFRDSLGRIDEAYASELLQVRHAWAHVKSFSDDDALRALDTAERLLMMIG